jgi:outer membrane protein TolC
MARETAAQSEVAYRKYVAIVLRTGTAVRKAWTELAYVEDAARLRERALKEIEQAVALSAADYTTGAGMGNLEAQVRALNAAALVRSELATLRDRRTAARARFKYSLGLAPDDPDPTWPVAVLAPATVLPEAELWSLARATNPEIASMQAMVDMAVSSVAVAERSRAPDFALGAMVDLKASPLMLRPTASVTLPIWREKIAATIASAEARRDAAVARLDAERLAVAAELARMIFMVRESDRMIEYIDATALPNIDRILASAEAGYQSGMGRASEIPATRLMALDMQLERLGALRQREDAIAELALIIAEVSPGVAPLVAGAPGR